MTRPRAAALALVGVLVLLLTACSSPSGGDQFRFTSANKVGTLIPVKDRKKAEDVSGALLSGGKTSLAAYKGKVVVVTFWASWCGPCTVETPQFDLMYRKLKSSGLQVLGVNTKNLEGPARSFVADNQISFPNIYDFDGKVLLQLGNIVGAALPITVLIDKQQRVAAVYIDKLSTSQVEPVVKTLSAET